MINILYNNKVNLFSCECEGRECEQWQKSELKKTNLLTALSVDSSVRASARVYSQSIKSVSSMTSPALSAKRSQKLQESANSNNLCPKMRIRIRILFFVPKSLFRFNSKLRNTIIQAGTQKICSGLKFFCIRKINTFLRPPA